MKKGFTGIVKGLVIAGVIIGCLASMIVAIGLKNFWIFLGGVFVSFVAFSAMGMVVEISQNIAKCGEMLDKLVKNQQNENSPASEANNLANPTPADLPKKNDDFWKCPECGAQNEKFRYSCQRCGRNR